MTPKPRYSHHKSRFSQEHGDQLPDDAHMVDLDGLIWLPYSGGGDPLILVELKPENPREKGWFVAQTLGRLAGRPAALVYELENGRYRVEVATDRTGWRPYAIPGELTIDGWYERVELPLRRRRDAQTSMTTEPL